MNNHLQRLVLEGFLKNAGVDVPAAARLCHLGRRFNTRFPTIAAEVNPEGKPWRPPLLLQLAQHVAGVNPASVQARNVVVTSAKKAKKISKTTIFMRSPEWRKLRYDIFRREGYACRACGAEAGMKNAAGDAVRLEVDHIRPISKHWHARLDPENLQILCRDCNKGKGARHQDDLRRSAS